MASTVKHLRSSTADKRPVASGLADGQFAINTASGTPGVFFKDSNGGVVKVGPVHVGASAPNAVPAGSAGNSLGELWVDNSLTTPGLNYYTGSAFVNLTPSGTTTTVGLVELATPAETQTGTDAIRAVTPSGLQSKVSDSTSTTSSTTIASSTAVKTAYDLASAALPKAGGTITGELLIGATGSLVFEGSTDNTLETTIAVVDPTADRTITFPDVSGTVVTTGDTGSVTSAMITNDTIVNADINSAAAIAYSKLATLTAGNIILGNASNVATSTTVTGDVTIGNTGVTAIASDVIVNADINTSAAIAGTKISPDFGSQNTTTTGTSTAASFIPTSSTAPTNGVYLPAANTVAISTNGAQRVTVDSTGKVGIGIASPGESIHVFGSASAPNQKIRIQTHDTASAVAGIQFFSRDASNNNKISEIVTSNADLTFKTDNTERARIDSSGRLLVGTSSTSTAALLQVQGNQSNSGGGADFYLRRGEAATSITSGESIGYIAFTDNAGGTFGAIECVADAAAGTNDFPGRLTFSTTKDGQASPTEACRINSTQQLLIGTATNYGNITRVEVRFTGGGTEYGLGLDAETLIGSTQWIEFTSGGGTQRGTIDWSGTAVRYNTSSDYRLKENVTPVADGLTRLQQLKPSRFNFIEYPELTVDGFIAHEVQSVVPEAVTGEKDAVDDDGNPIYQGIDQSKLVPLLTAALQEAVERIEQVETEKAEQQIVLNDLLARVAALEAARSHA